MKYMPSISLVMNTGDVELQKLELVGADDELSPSFSWMDLDES
jgi:hypothetical protein